ncbi:MAG: DNA polymerase III subunit gamma/tau [Bacteroidales bacterium]|nr:DNA polymerase III subunit gamma/tau [Bacteroidales bacterium]
MARYIVSARKYRPDSFGSLIGQDNIARTLKNSILRGQLAHAYLFCGPRGVGKTSAARIFAKTINCSSPGPEMEPCGECESCVSFREGRSYCIHELDAASNNGVEDIKALMEQVQIPPQVGRYSVYIIDEVHMLTQSAFNAFLKTLEEPPAHAIFILATTEKHKIIPTILSRCQTYDFNRIGIPDIVRNLRDIAGRENIRIDDESLHVIAQKADGAMRDALTIFDQTVAFCGADIRYEDVIRNLNVLDYEYGFRLTDAFLAKDYGTALLIFDEILSRGFNSLHFISSLGSHFRDLLVSRTGGLDALLDLPDSLRGRYGEQASRCTLKFLYEALDAVSRCEAGYRAATNQRLHIEFTLMRISFLGGLPEQPPVVSGTSALPGRPAVQPAAAVAPVPAEPSIGTVPAASAVQVQPAAAVSAAPAAAPASAASPDVAPDAAGTDALRPARKRPSKRASGLSLSALMSDEEITVELAPEDAAGDDEPLPDAEAVKGKWPELAAMYTSQPRLANALGTARLDVKESDGLLVLSFSLVNEAQKNWIAEKKLRELEERFRKICASSKIRLEPDVLPDDKQEKRIYMPTEKAQDLMTRNSEVGELIKDLALDIR